MTMLVKDPLIQVWNMTGDVLRDTAPANALNVFQGYRSVIRAEIIIHLAVIIPSEPSILP